MRIAIAVIASRSARAGPDSGTGHDQIVDRTAERGKSLPQVQPYGKYRLGCRLYGREFVHLQARRSTKTFTAAEITTDQTGLGTLVSVPLLLMIDTDGSLIWQMPAEGMGHGICNALAVNNP
jgi:hypothetical protein